MKVITENVNIRVNDKITYFSDHKIGSLQRLITQLR